MSSFFTIGLADIRLFSIIGVLPHERREKQEIAIDIQVQMEKPRIQDELEETIDYRRISELCSQMAERKYFLLEAFAQDLGEALLKMGKVHYAKVEIRKKHAIPSCAFAYVIWEKGKKR